jgi:2-polyprenyl-3-methyl-5-hydroxy-6-metoxy-1,4-benzoquinol methylase
MIEKSMQCGVGFKMDCEHDFSNSIERAQKPFLNHSFLEAVDRILPVTQLLQKNGCRVVDIGCGTCTALRALASRYSGALFCGFDISEKVLSLAKELNISSNAKIQTHLIDYSSAFPLSIFQSSFDLAITTDALHDTSDPLAMLKAVHSLLTPDGIYLLCEPNPKLASHWSAPMHFGISLAACLPSGTTSDPYTGLGQLGLTDTVLKNLAIKAGFAVHPQTHVEDLFHSYYILSKLSLSSL